MSSTASIATRTVGCSCLPSAERRGSIARWCFGDCLPPPCGPDLRRRGRTSRCKDVLARHLADGDHRGVLDLALYRDGVELLDNRLRAADDAHLIAAKDLGLDHRRRREHAQAVFAELLRDRAVVQLR